MRLVSVVTRTRSFFAVRIRISPSRSSICPLVGLHQLGVDQAGGPDDLLDKAVRFARARTCRGSRRGTRPGPRGPGTRRSSEGGCPSPRAAGSRGPRGSLAGHVALVHGADLRDRDVRFVDDHQEVVGEVVDEAVRGAPGLVRRCARSSSRCRCRTPSPASFRGRTWCASAGAGPPPACLALQDLRAARRARPRCA